MASTSTSTAHPKVLKEGWGIKQGSLIKNWKLRYFVLRAVALSEIGALGETVTHVLVYFKSQAQAENGHEPTGVVTLVKGKTTVTEFDHVTKDVGERIPTRKHGLKIESPRYDSKSTKKSSRGFFMVPSEDVAEWRATLEKLDSTDAEPRRRLLSVVARFYAQVNTQSTDASTDALIDEENEEASRVTDAPSPSPPLTSSPSPPTTSPPIPTHVELGNLDSTEPRGRLSVFIDALVDKENKEASIVTDALSSSLPPPTSTQVSTPVELIFPSTVRLWIDGKHARGQDADRMCAQAKEVLPWLTGVIINAHTNPSTKQAAEALLLKKDFTANLSFLGCWHPLHEQLRVQLKTLGDELLDEYTKLDLGKVLSDQHIGCGKLKTHPKLRQQASHDTGPLTHASLLPNLDAFFDFSGDHPEAMDERELLIVILMLSKVFDDVFQNKVQNIIGNVKGATLCGALIKQFSRAFNKAYSDHQGKPQPRTAYNIDTVRALLMVTDPDTMIKVLQLLAEGFDGVAKVKNLFTLSPTERADRFHLLTLMLTVVVDSGLTFGEMINDSKCRAMIVEFIANVPRTEPKERWEAMCKRALDYLSQPSIANEKVLLFAELQIILNPFALVRTQMHFVYKVFRADTPGQLYEDFLQSSGDLVDKEAYNLYSAAFRGQLSVVARLLDRGTDPNEKRSSSGCTPLAIASQNNHPDVVKLLIERGGSLNMASGGGTPLYMASQQNHLEVVKLLVSNNAKIDQANSNGFTPLFIASQSNRLEIVKFLVSNNAAINQASNTGFTPLLIASQKNHLQVVKFLVSNNAAINQANNTGFTPLLVASQINHLEVVKFLVTNNAATNQAQNDGATPLCLASSKNHLEVVKFLVSNNAEINQAGYHEATPLYIASEDNHLELVKYLVSNNAAINQADENEATPLFTASESNNLEVVKFLVSNNADINQAQDTGRYPLNAASSKGNLEVVKFLAEAGADLNVGIWGTPLEEATNGGKHEVAEYLQQRGAKFK